MPVIDLLRKNRELYPNECALVSINPGLSEMKRKTWKDYELIESVRPGYFRREITWSVFDE
ncbi:MAG: long-chain fatty acid--CoA ligase, partial [Oscillospiraceae bacterium]|nr:long-chain fatty acid--CoA ligase [Oscillospiraceae bacterium]